MKKLIIFTFALFLLSCEHEQTTNTVIENIYITDNTKMASDFSIYTGAQVRQVFPKLFQTTATGKPYELVLTYKLNGYDREYSTFTTEYDINYQSRYIYITIDPGTVSVQLTTVP